MASLLGMGKGPNGLSTNNREKGQGGAKDESGSARNLRVLLSPQTRSRVYGGKPSLSRGVPWTASSRLRSREHYPACPMCAPRKNVQKKLLISAS